MGNLTLPTPVAVAGAAICVLGGYLLGSLAGPGSSELSTATVASYDRSDSRLCLTGEGVEGREGAEDGELCGTWRRTEGSPAPVEGDRFRFLSMTFHEGGADAPAGERPVTVIYGDVVS